MPLTSQVYMEHHCTLLSPKHCGTIYILFVPRCQQFSPGSELLAARKIHGSPHLRRVRANLMIQ